MASKAAHKRLTKEFLTMQREPPPFVWAAPDEKNILTWNFLIRGPPDSPFAGGEYHGVLLFPAEYPFKPPGIKMITPSGRFQPDRRICFSMSDFHPGSWNPAWSCATILTGLLSFMLSDEMTTGSVTSSDSHKRAFAQRSHAWNIIQPRFKEAFPEHCAPELRELPNMGEQSRGKPESPTTTRAPFIFSGASSSVPTSPTSTPTPVITTANSDIIRRRLPVPNRDNTKAPTPTTGWATTWRGVIWEKWRWGALIALAVVVSRFSSGA
ncbi:UBC-like protein [Athelia psychrophila]|uniref:Ubiquitin-conjugating enzyme E2 6 n=1 Tax=Athelia psychrophila TaxID=1759441 RepID=A0A166A0L9_9AGAM|nr:UBC-like protein [Fibularhizoctonia sp. CBS 109695]